MKIFWWITNHPSLIKKYFAMKIGNDCENLFKSLWKTILPLYVEISVWLNKTIGWEKHCLFKTPLKILGWFRVCRDVVAEIAKWWMVMFRKNAHCVLVLTEQPITCATTFTPIWGGAWSYNLLMLVLDASTTRTTSFHEGMVWGPTPWPGSSSL